MKILRLLMMPVLFLALTFSARGGDAVAHFTRVEIPKDEMRLLNLSRLVEYRCNYELDTKTRGAMLIAEYHRGASVTDYLVPLFISMGPPDAGAKRTGTLSIAWHIDFHNLICAQDGLWDSAAIHLPDFRMDDGYFFQNSPAETRKPTGKNAAIGMEFKLYPVMGLCGERQLQLGFDGREGVQAFVDACERAGVQGEVVIYLYFSGGEEPCMDFKKSPPVEEKQKAEN